MITRLSISPCEVGQDGAITVKSTKFDVMLNPSSYTHGYEICYNKRKALGQSGGQPKYNHTGDEKVNFDIVIDGTGAAVDQWNDTPVDVNARIKALSDVVYKYVGNNHEPNLVRLLWGSFIFFGRLTSMSVEYTLFKPSGVPLRAKIKLAFAGYVGSKEEALSASRSSPDLTHLVEFKAGDNLPLLCFRIYKNSSYYLEVARINGITNFRHIRPGTLINFPPLK